MIKLYENYKNMGLQLNFIPVPKVMGVWAIKD